MVLIPPGCTRGTLSPRGASSPLCRLVVVSGATVSMVSVARTRLCIGLGVSLFSERRLDFLTECMVDTFRRWDTFLPFLELLVSFLQMSALGAASTDILLSLPMLLLDSSFDSLAG